MGDLFGFGSASSGSQGFNVTGGGNPADFQFGPSPFDLSQLVAALSSNLGTITNRYNQLGLGGSTMEKEDLAAAPKQEEAAIGQEQTQTVTNPAINPALQPPINQLVGVNSQTGAQGASTLGTLAGTAAGLGLGAIGL
jgi:hypothetical protein